jgi:hypothetical protein
VQATGSSWKPIDFADENARLGAKVHTVPCLVAVKPPAGKPSAFAEFAFSIENQAVLPGLSRRDGKRML